jgi:hypothetical protein
MQWMGWMDGWMYITKQPPESSYLRRNIKMQKKSRIADRRYQVLDKVADVCSCKNTGGVVQSDKIGKMKIACDKCASGVRIT